MILDEFAGPGGWDVAARDLGLDPIGVEIDPAARATREAAGLRTHETHDVRRLDLTEFIGLTGLIASPPCQTFSMAGDGAGRWALHLVLDELAHLTKRYEIRYDRFEDHRTALVLEPMRAALLLQPEWLAWEQVPPVQPIWQMCAWTLRQRGYSVWTGPVRAEAYGVPQSRRRAVLLASRVHEMKQPPPTHARYRPRAHVPDPLPPYRTIRDVLGDVTVFSSYGSKGIRVADQPAATVTTKGDLPIAAVAALQTFPPDHPWQGTLREQRRQVGDAVPPLLARHLLRMVIGRT